jgi:hypothetical protein
MFVLDGAIHSKIIGAVERVITERHHKRGGEASNRAMKPVLNLQVKDAVALHFPVRRDDAVI